MGKLAEFGPAVKVFTNPEQKLTEDYVLGKFG
jgi:ABC-type phosphate transport system ATPase subunit